MLSPPNHSSKNCPFTALRFAHYWGKYSKLDTLPSPCQACLCLRLARTTAYRTLTLNSTFSIAVTVIGKPVNQLSSVTPCFISPEGEEDLETAFATVQEKNNDDLLIVCTACKFQIHFCLLFFLMCCFITLSPYLSESLKFGICMCKEVDNGQISNVKNY